MGFLDYLSRHPKHQPHPLSLDDTQYIINLTNGFKFMLSQNSINYTSATRTIPDKEQTINLTTKTCKHVYNCDSAF